MFIEGSICYLWKRYFELILFVLIDIFLFLIFLYPGSKLSIRISPPDLFWDYTVIGCLILWGCANITILMRFFTIKKRRIMIARDRIVLGNLFFKCRIEIPFEDIDYIQAVQIRGYDQFMDVIKSNGESVFLSFFLSKKNFHAVVTLSRKNRIKVRLVSKPWGVMDVKRDNLHDITNRYRHRLPERRRKEK